MKTYSQKLKHLTLCAVFAAIVFLATSYLPRIPFSGGYIHIGDTFIYLAASILPFPYAALAGAIGAGLADALGGYILWAPGSIIIKALMVWPFCAKSNRIATLRNLTATVPAGVICIGGYYIYESILIGNFVAALASVYMNSIQAIASALLFVALSLFLDKTKISEKLIRRFLQNS